METILEISIGLILIATIIIIFLRLKKRRYKQNMAEEVHVDVLIKDGIFKPEIIKISEGKILIMHFTRKDPSCLAESIEFPQLYLNYYLSLDKPTEVTIPPRAFIFDEIEFVCRIGVYAGCYSGKIIVKRERKFS